MSSRGSTRKRDVELSMAEDRCSKINADIFHRLSLRLVDGNSECKAQRKLQPGKDKRKIVGTSGWCEGGARNEDNIGIVFTAKDLGFQYSVRHPANHHPGTITKALGWRKVTKKDDGAAWFEGELPGR